MAAPEGDLTIDQLAARAGMTVRNVRSHASRGLLPPPQLRGRTAYYGADHVARLQLIAGLQQQGFSLAAIEAVVQHTPASSAEQALAFYRGVLAPWRPEPPLEMSYAELTDWLGVEPQPATLDRLHAEGDLERLAPDRVRITNPALLRAGAQAVRLGIPVDAVMALGSELSKQAQAISELFVGLFRDTVWRDHVARGRPQSQLSEVHRIVEALQPVAAQALLAAFRSAMPKAIEAFVQDEYERRAGAAERNGR
ncbi:MAG: MerR family transcriptional regulator [Actinomycetota bacterium]|nr:MerR family transcriptional regulator [Actinomycetota bacterium]